MTPPYLELLFRLLSDLAAIVILLFGIYYPRYRRKETAITAALVNIFTFAVLSILSSVQFSVAAGFGLFAILALFSLRSEQIERLDVAYFFGGISLAVITSIQGTAPGFMLLMLAVVLLASFVLDHPRLLRPSRQMRVVLDTIPRGATAGMQPLTQILSERLGAEIISARILRIDYITETLEADINVRDPA